MAILGEILSSKAREKVFQHLFDGQSAELHVRELERRTGCSIGTIQTELKKLSRLELVNSRRDGNRLYYFANREHPLYSNICGLVSKTVGMVALLNTAISELHDVEIAFLFGSMADGTSGAQSDVDLMVVGSLGLRTLTATLSTVSESIGREINPHVITVSEFRKRVQSEEHFIMSVMNSSRVYVKGGDYEFGKLVG